jgi:hypothetical protein
MAQIGMSEITGLAADPSAALGQKKRGRPALGGAAERRRGRGKSPMAQIGMSDRARVAELADAYGLGPYAERLKGSTPFPRMFVRKGVEANSPAALNGG